MDTDNDFVYYMGSIQNADLLTGSFVELDEDDLWSADDVCGLNWTEFVYLTVCPAGRALGQ